MKFYTDSWPGTVELHTLDELKAYALGGTGKIVIDFCYPDEGTGEICHHIEAGERYAHRKSQEEEYGKED